MVEVKKVRMMSGWLKVLTVVMIACVKISLENG